MKEQSLSLIFLINLGYFMSNAHGWQATVKPLKINADFQEDFDGPQGGNTTAKKHGADLNVLTFF
jgi:hypothetical protein